MTADPDRRRTRFPFVARILAAMALGAALGLLHRAVGPLDADAWGSAGAWPLAALSWIGRRAEPLGMLGGLIVNLIKGLAGPLLLFAVLDAFLRTQVRWRDAARLVAIAGFNAVLALAIGLGISNLIRPGRFLTIPPPTGAAVEARPLKFPDDLLGFVPTSVAQPFVDNAILSIVLLAVLGGAALRRVKEAQIAEGRDDYLAVERGVSTLFRAVEVALAWVVALVPIAVFGVVARTIALQGLAPVGGLAVYVGVAALGLAIQVAVVYQAWVVAVARMPLSRFWGGARDAVVFALGASSSLATLPVTLRCLKKMGVSDASARLSACVGTNLNNDGILLYEAMAVLFVAQVYGIELSLSQQILAAASCAVAGVGIAGIPEAGLISLALVLATVGLPTEILPLLLTVDWLLSRLRAATNVTSDILVAVLLDRFAARPASDPDGI